METSAIPALLPTARAAHPTTFPEWAAEEVNRLLKERAAAVTPAERIEVELRLAVVYDAAQRYGHSLAELAEL